MYEDFDELDKTNTFWTWLPDEKGNLSFGKYEADYAVAGDTDSIMMKFGNVGAESEEDYIMVADEIGEIINETFPDFIMKAFNCPKERNTSITTGREVVFDKALFLTMKRYIMHVIDDEGKRCDKLKITGVEIIKSDTSQAVRDMLMELVNMILDDFTREEVIKRINEMKEEFKQKSIFEIAIPSGTKTLTKANDQYAEEGNLKAIHYTAKAAFWWNRMKSNQDMEVYSGQKIGLVYVKHRQFNAIGYPIDLQTLPDWFNEIPLDYDKMWTGAYKKLVNYLKSMEWDIKSMKTNHRKELFGF